MSKYLFLALSLVFIACTPNNTLQEASYNGYAQGTTFEIHYLYRGEDIPYIGKKLENLFVEVDNSMSTYLSSSQISRLNKGESLSPDDHFKRVHQKSIEVWQASEGFFDPTVGKLVRFWGFGPDARRIVDTSEVDSIRNYIGLNKLAPIGENWQLPKGMELDYNAIAQGFTVDLLAELLASEGIENYMVEVGGEVRCLGHNLKNEAWKIGVDKPVAEIDKQDRFQFILGLDSLALATSGNYRKFWVDTLSGMRYAHTINTQTGYPAKNRLLSTSVLAPTCMEADAFATAFMSMGLQRSLAYLKNADHQLEVYFIYTEEGKEDWQVYQSDGFKERILNN